MKGRSHPARYMTYTQKRRVDILACGVFQPLLKRLQILRQAPGVNVTLLPSRLHLRPAELEARLRSETEKAQKRRSKIVCLYGDCFAGIGDFCQEQGAVKLPGCHCYEMLLGSDRFKKIYEESAGTFFLEQDLLKDFEKACAEPLELHDDEIRTYLFKDYNRLLYVRQPEDAGLLPEAERIARFLGLPLQVRLANYSFLLTMLEDLLLRNNLEIR